MTMPQWIFFAPILWILGLVAISIWYRRSKGEPIFPRLPDDADFGEKGCSGRSLKSPLSKIGGSTRCLLVAVRKGKLIITPQFPFNLMFLPEIYGLDIKEPVSTVASVKPVSSLFQRALRIEFTDGGPAPVEVVLHDERGFEQAIGSSLMAPGDREIRANTGRPKSRTFFFVRAFLAIWGAGALFAAITGFQDDQRFRRDGVAIMATYVNPDRSLDRQVQMGVLQYQVDGVVYRLNSIYGIGLFEVGEREKVYYLRSNPQEARQESYSNFNLLWLVFGVLGLSASIFGGMIAKRIW
jgi:hypothetical protein